MREIDPKVFGPGTWTVTHVLGLVSDESGRRRDYRFFSLFVFRMVHGLPCGECRKHAVRYLDRHPLPISRNAGSLFEWTVRFHNAVNKRLKKPLFRINDARQLYKNTEVILKNNVSGATCSLATQGCEDQPL